MRTFNKNIALLTVWIMATQPLLAAVPVGSITPSQSSTGQSSVDTSGSESIDQRLAQGVELTGEFDDRRAEMRVEMRKDHKPGMAEDGTPMEVSPMVSLPVVDTALAERAGSVRAEEPLRVLIHLNYLPHAEVLKSTMTRFENEVNAVEQSRVGFLKEQEQFRSRDTQKDSEDYATMFSMSDEKRTELRALNERNEALSLQIKQAITAELRGLIDQSQQPIKDEIKRLGGTVEFGTIAGNVVVALVPASAIEELGKTPGILRMVEDSLMEGHLNIADNAAMVDPTDSSLMGLWDNNFTGSIYDPAIIDSGIDTTHPAMANSSSPLRTNYGTWYLAAANGSASFDDSFTTDDLQGHGTHVAGIVASYGSIGYLSNLGMAYGVEKVVNLKSGFRNTSGLSSMFWSDKYFIVERGLYNTGALIGGDFADDIDGMNLSYGGDTTLDDTDGSRFWDSVISTYPDLPVTISAGNSGPSNTLFSDPAISYNAITVANANDRNTTSRADDIINSGSTVGPTLNSRKKPDVAAPGTSIRAPNYAWENFGVDHVNKTGTSMAAPMVLGIIMDLADAAVFDELAVKALLINTAQKNLAGMNIESDSDGWDPQIGWGYVNAFAAYFHRFDTFSDSVTPRDTEGDYQLYRGSMRDEGASGEGRDRATLVWNRAATYLSDAAPTEFYSLTDLNMRLYRESNNGLIANDTDGNDNVHQVRIGAGAPDTDVVVNVYAWSTTFANGNASETYALATEDGFERVDHPVLFQGIAIWPESVEPNEVFDITFWLRNDSEIASHNNVFEFLANNGFVLLGGGTSNNVGSVDAGGITSMVTYEVRAPSTATGPTNLSIRHNHNSYNEPYGNFNWNITVNVEVDITPPTPNPMGFATAPFAESQTSISMLATIASDVHQDPIQYYHDYMSSPSGGNGGSDSGWGVSRSFLDNGLQTNNEYCYREYARDSANFPNLTTPSAIECAYTLQATPNIPTAVSVTTNSIVVQPVGTPANLTLGSSALRINETATGQSSGWVQSTSSITFGGLLAANTYKFEAQARNGDGIATGVSDVIPVFTLANPPAANSLTALSDTAIRVQLNANGNQEAQYQIENTTTGATSSWSFSLNWNSTGLTCGTSYNFQARARNQDSIQTIIVPLGSQATQDCSVDTDGDGVEDSADNCTLVVNANQRDTNGDGYGNACDPDLNNDGTVNFVDISLFTASFPSSGVDLDEDFNGDNLVNFIDYVLYSTYFLDPPGPSGIAP